MKDLLCDGFQETVDECLIRHRSIIDVMSKLQEATAKLNRAVAKSVTSCGCIRVNAEKQRFPLDIPLHDIRKYVGSHIEGEPCEQCKEVLEAEVGNVLFYLAALCNLLHLNLYDAMIKETKKLSTLGVFNFS